MWTSPYKLKFSTHQARSNDIPVEEITELKNDEKKTSQILRIFWFLDFTHLLFIGWTSDMENQLLRSETNPNHFFLSSESLSFRRNPAW